MFLWHHVDHTIKKLREQLANIVTLANLGCGVFAIFFILQDELRMSLLFIIIAALFDRLDGACARRFNSTSEFGKQLDSLSDIISFGVAPALLIYKASLSFFGLTGMIVSILFIFCGAIRLAKFNITENESYFVGLPITAAGCLLTLQLFFVPFIPSYVFLFTAILLSFLMISPFTIRKI